MTGESVWNSLEILKLIASISTPLLVLFFGFLISKNLEALAQKHWENRTVIEWRIKVFDKVSPPLYDIYCYLLHLGHWKKLRPTDILQKKRKLDKKIYTSAALFSSDLISTYESFMEACFLSYRDWDKSAGIRVEKTRHESAFGNNWEKAWDDFFVEDHECALELDIQKKYSELMNLLSKEVGVGLIAENHNEVRNRLFGWWSNES